MSLRIHAACQFLEATDDDDCKIVVAHASGRQCWLVVLFCSRVFLWAGAGEIPVSWSDPDAMPPSSGTIPSWRASWESPVYYTLRTGGNPRTVGLGSSVVSTAFPFLKLLLGTVALRSAWIVVGLRRRAQRLRVCIVSLFRHRFHFFSLWVCVCAAAPACGVAFVSMLVCWSLLYL